jgi:hypothetical protein
MSTNLIVQIEVTDLFAGEPNYSWVKRYEIRGMEGKSDLAIVRAAKKLISWNGLRCKTESLGDDIKIKPIGQNMACFISFHTFGSAS